MYDHRWFPFFSLLFALSDVFFLYFFFFNVPATTDIYTLSLHDALPILIPMLCVTIFVILVVWFLLPRVARLMIHTTNITKIRSEERFSRNAETDLVCRLLLEKKKKKQHNTMHNLLKITLQQSRQYEVCS